MRIPSSTLQRRRILEEQILVVVVALFGNTTKVLVVRRWIIIMLVVHHFLVTGVTLLDQGSLTVLVTVLDSVDPRSHFRRAAWKIDHVLFDLDDFDLIIIFFVVLLAQDLGL